MVSWNQWPECHRYLLLLSLLLVLLLLACYMLGVHPQLQQRNLSLKNKEAAEKENHHSAWPRDPERLQAYLNDLKRRIANEKNGTGLKFLAEKTLNQATSMFASQIRDEYGQVRNFIHQASQIEYRDQYDRLSSRLEGRGIYLHKTIFGLDESSSEEFKYQMLLKLWTVEKVYDILAGNSLQVVQDPHLKTDASRRHNAARISVLPVKEYVLDRKNGEIYLQEYPVQFTVRGSLDNLVKAIRALQSSGSFLPVKQLECVHVMPPPGHRQRLTSEKVFRIDQIEATLVCSSFFRPESSDRKTLPVFRKSRAVVIPPGI